MKTERKVYDYNAEKVKDALLSAFKKRGREATVADLVTVTALPKAQVDEQLPAVADEFGARLKVTESGEILYSFPDGFRSKYRGFGPAAKRFLKAAKKTAVTVATWLFKAWIAVMLVGYFVFFIALAVLAFLASIAASAAGNKDSDNRRGDSGAGFALSMHLLDFFIRLWFYSELFKTDGQRRRDFERKKDRRPLHKAVFSFVFGDGDPNASWDATVRKAVIEFVQANKGVMTLPEFAAISGQSLMDAERDVTRYLVELEGRPEVTEDGTMYFAFPALMRRADAERPFWDVRLPFRQTAAFSSNPKGMNGWFVAFNAVNLVFGGYFLAFSTGMAADLLRDPISYLYRFAVVLFAELLAVNPIPLITVALGVVPVAFAIFFYLVPAVRKARLDAENARVAKANLKAAAWRTVLRQPDATMPALALEALPPPNGSGFAASDAEKAVQDIAAETGGEPLAAKDGSFAWSFKELSRQSRDIASVRASVNRADFGTGKVIFDSHEKTTS